MYFARFLKVAPYKKDTQIKNVYLGNGMVNLLEF